MTDLSTLMQYAVVAFASLFILVDPLATAPLFIVMTEGDPPDKRRQMARRAACTACLTLIGFALLGDVLLRLFSLTLSAFRIAGGIILFGIALNMIRLRRVREIQTDEEVQEGIMQDDIALIPLAFPMLSGPGAIATVMALTQHAPTLGHRVVILAAIVVTCGLAYVILGHAVQVAAFLGQTGLRFLSRLLGLLLAVIAVQFILQGVEETVIRLLHQLRQGGIGRTVGGTNASTFFTLPSSIMSFSDYIIASRPMCAFGQSASLSMGETGLLASVERGMECIHIYLDTQYVGTMACPQCRTRRVVNVPQQCPQVLAVIGKRSVTTTCRCGAIFAAYFDLRRHPRKAVQLRGTLGDPQTGIPLSDTVIFSLSVHGLGFTLATAINLHIGERYTTSFGLDDAEQSLIQECIIVRRL